jgi:hexokinase
MQIKNMTLDELKALIRETVEETLEDFFCDPDEGKEVREEVKQQLLKSLKQTEAGERGIPTEEVYKKLGLNPR